MAKRGRPKKKTFNELLREKMQQSFSEAVERQRPKAEPRQQIECDYPFATQEEKRRIREKRYRNTPKGKASQKRRTERYLAKPEKRAHKKKYRREWYAANRESELQKAFEYRVTHKEEHRIYQREHRAKIKENEPEKYQELLEKERQYRKTHKTRNPETTKKYQQKWLKKFKKEYGMSYSTYMYRLKHGTLDIFAA